jgi:hypothetical protein
MTRLLLTRIYLKEYSLPGDPKLFWQGVHENNLKQIT